MTLLLIKLFACLTLLLAIMTVPAFIGIEVFEATGSHAKAIVLAFVCHALIAVTGVALRLNKHEAQR